MPVSGPTEAISPTILGAARRFRRVVVIALVVGALGAYLYTALSAPGYSAVAGIDLAPPPESVTAPGAATTHLTPAEYQQQQLAIMQSTAVAQTAARRVRARMPKSHLTGTTLRAATSVKASTAGLAPSTGATDTVTVTLRSPKEAALAADAVIAAYIEAFHRQISRQAAQTEAELAAQISTVTHQLKALPVTPKTTTTKPPKSTTTTKPAKSSTTTTTTKASGTTTTTKASGTTTTTSSATTAVIFTGAKPDIARLVAQLYRARPLGRLLATTTTTTTTTSSSTTTTTTPTTTTTTSSSSTTTSSSSTTTTTAPSASVAAERFALTTTLADLTRTKAQILVNRAIDLKFTPTYVPAKLPTTAAAAHTLRNVIIGALIGLVLGLVIAFALASSRRRFEHAEDPSQLYAAPLLATVPAFVVEEWVEVALPMVSDPTGEAAEGYRAVATALRARRGPSGSLVTAITACDLGAGTTTVTANVGLALAEMGERTVVVDADTLGRGLARALLNPIEQHGIPEIPAGLSDLIDGHELEETMVPSAHGRGLWVVPSGRDPNMAVRRWQTGRLRTVLEELAGQFDMVLIDTPPIGMASYALDVVATAGHLILVVPHHDSVRLHEQVAERLGVIGAELIGYVYNGKPLDVDFAPYYPVVPISAEAAQPPGVLARAGGSHVRVIEEFEEDVTGVEAHAGVLVEDLGSGDGGGTPAALLGAHTGGVGPPDRGDGGGGHEVPEPSQPGGWEDDTLIVDAVDASADAVPLFHPRRSRLPWRRRNNGYEEDAAPGTRQIGPDEDTLVVHAVGPTAESRMFGPESRLPWRRWAEERDNERAQAHEENGAQEPHQGAEWFTILHESSSSARPEDDTLVVDAVAPDGEAFHPDHLGVAEPGTETEATPHQRHRPHGGQRWRRRVTEVPVPEPPAENGGGEVALPDAEEHSEAGSSDVGQQPAVLAAASGVEEEAPPKRRRLFGRQRRKHKLAETQAAEAPIANGSGEVAVPDAEGSSEAGISDVPQRPLVETEAPQRRSPSPGGQRWRRRVTKVQLSEPPAENGGGEVASGDAEEPCETGSSDVAQPPEANTDGH